MNDEITKEHIDGTIVSPLGFRAAGIHSGVKRKRNDLGVIYCEKIANAAAVYTLNQVVAAPITLTKKTLQESKQLQAVIVNSGNANACTGRRGYEDATTMQRVTAETLQVSPKHVAVASTGVIGEQMPMDKITQHIKKLKLGNTEHEANQFGEAILTTDTFTKATCFQTEIDGETVTIAGA